MAKKDAPVKEIHQPSTGEEREKRIEDAKAAILKKFGEGSIMKYGDDDPQLEVEAINPFGSELLWGYATRFDDVRGVVHVDAVLASRRQVNEWYGQQSAAHPAADGHDQGADS